MIEKVERRLEGWCQAGCFPGGRLVFLRSMLSLIPIFHLMMSKLPVGDRK